MTSHDAPPEEFVGFWARVLASLIDTVVFGVVIVPIVLAVYGPAYLNSTSMVAGPIDFLVTWVLPAVAVILFWIFKESTPGKMALGMRVVDAATGGHPTTAQYVGRYFAYYLSAIPLGLGFVWVALDPQKQGWHDKLAGTVVVRRPRASQ